jgi:hypothetical protein
MKIFLDIDGVMVHANPHKAIENDEDGFYKFNAVAVEILNSIINPNGDDELILSTSHRFRFTLSKWHEIFSKRGIAIKNISILNLPVDPASSRKMEVLKWIEERDFRPEELIIIDDDKLLNDLPEP